VSEEKRAYKLMRRDRGGYYSCNLPIGERQRYRVNIPTKRREGWGSLCLFRDLVSLSRFVFLCVGMGKWEGSDLVVFLADYVPSDEGFVYKPWLRSFWDGGKRLTVKPDFIPPGTVYANEVTIRDRVGQKRIREAELYIAAEGEKRQ